LIQKLSKEIVLNWIRLAAGESFSNRDIHEGLDIGTPEGKTHLRVILKRLKDDGVIAFDTKHVRYRLVEFDAPIQYWKRANPKNIVPIKWPFELEKYVRILCKSLVVIGGDSNVGKSAFAYNLITMNWKSFKMVLFNSESGDEELNERLSYFPDSKDWPDDIIRFRTHNFADVIVPDAINIIDYIEPPDPLFLMATILREIWEKLTTGVAVVMLQKPPGRDLPYGKDSTKWLARLLLSIDKGKLTIVKAKSWANKDDNPNGKKWTFQLVNGAKFLNLMEIVE